MLAGGSSRLNKIVLLAFADREPAPRVVVKLARVAEAERGLEHEASALRGIERTAASTRADIPRVLGSGHLGGFRAVSETPVGGTPLVDGLSAVSIDWLVDHVADVLAAWAEGSPRCAPDHYWDRLVEPHFRTFSRRLGAVVDPALLAAMRDALRALPPLPIVPEHRDCSPWNVHVTPGAGIALVDWESAELEGLPGLDLIYFLANTAFLLEGTLASGREPTTYRRFVGTEWDVARACQRALVRYCDATGIDTGVLATLRAFTWMVHASCQWQRHSSARAARDQADPSRGSVFFALWLEEMKHGKNTT
jgi:hypothetical protein